jgi:capsular exopolysaccharide synthesis family protein
MISRTMGEVQLGAQLLTNNVSILDEAAEPRYPIKPRKKLNLLIGAMLGVFFGLSTAFFMDYLDNTFRSPDDIEKYLQMAVLAVVPKAGNEGIKERAVKEAYQSLRTSVIFSSESRQRKVVLITSTGPQEGKSSTIANLGRTLAAAGDRVIILDCDLRRPTQHFIHEMERDHGLTNYLAAPVDSADWTEYIKTEEAQGPHVITCGPIPPSPPDLLGSARFADLIGQLRESYDWVLIDSPPAASLADTTQLVGCRTSLSRRPSRRRSPRATSKWGRLPAMYRTSKSYPVLVCLLALAVGLGVPACKTKSGLDRALEERARWNVLALDWTQTADHVVRLSTRVNGPANSPLEKLTVRIVLQDAAGATIDQIWHTYELAELPSGGPKDITVSIPAAGPVEGLGVDRLLAPTEDELGHIVELSGF